MTKIDCLECSFSGDCVHQDGQQEEAVDCDECIICAGEYLVGGSGEIQVLEGGR